MSLYVVKVGNGSVSRAEFDTSTGKVIKYYLDHHDRAFQFRWNPAQKIKAFVKKDGQPAELFKVEDNFPNIGAIPLQGKQPEGLELPVTSHVKVKSGAMWVRSFEASPDNPQLLLTGDRTRAGLFSKSDIKAIKEHLTEIEMPCEVVPL